MKLLLVFCVLIGSAFCDISPLELVFTKLGTFKYKNDNNLTIVKNYYVPKFYRATWLIAKMTCSLYGLELAAFESLDELDAVKRMSLASPKIFSTWTHVDGVTLVGGSTTEWYLSSGKKVPFSIPWRAGDPEFHAGLQWCLAVGDIPNGQFAFVDIDCTQQNEHKFMCQEIESVTFEKDSCKTLTFNRKKENILEKALKVF